MVLVLASLLLAAPSLSLSAEVDGKTVKGPHVFARKSQKVELVAIVSKGAKVKTLRWFKLEPTAPSVDNTTPSFHFETIPYVATELSGCRDLERCKADLAPTVLPKVAALPGLGTMAFSVEATLEDGTALFTPGLESRFQGGLGKNVFKVTVRKSDDYLGYLTELLNTPYIFGSAGGEGKNQTDLLIGSDCADLAVYGRRRLGKKAEYTSSYAIDQQAPQRAKALSLDADGRALDASGKTIAFAPGDLVHFPGSRHVAVLYEDVEPRGVLDAKDVMLHTCWAPPTLEAVGASGCGSLPWRVLRFKDQ